MFNQDDMVESTLSQENEPSLPSNVTPSAPPDLTSLSVGPTSLTASGQSSSLSQAQKSPSDTPSHRSHDPASSLKRSDPFQFGSRYLLPSDDPYEFNAWDHVEIDDEQKQYAEAQYAAQRSHPVSDFDKHRFNSDPARWWNLFYAHNTTNFFKDRKWLHQEFPRLSTLTNADSSPATILEVGAGAGNTAFPILNLNANPNLKIHACDFSKKAVELIRSNEAYDEKVITASVWDVADPEMTRPEGLEEGSVDVVLMIFIFSALSPSQWQQAVRNIHGLLRPGGEVLFRDYGRGDLAQVRFKKGRYLEENFYVRGDGTRVYFFEVDELKKIWGGSVERGATEAGFEVLDLGVDRRLLVNRQRKLKMYRCWLQGRFRKN